LTPFQKKERSPGGKTNRPIGNKDNHMGNSLKTIGKIETGSGRSAGKKGRK